MINPLLDLLFPPKCPFCHRLLQTGEAHLCARCQKELPWACGPAGEQDLEFLAGCVSALWYRDLVPDGVHRFKFAGRCGYAVGFGLLTAQAVQDAWGALPFDAVTWVPLSRQRRRQRGYDQAELLAREVARRLGLPAAPTLVKRCHNRAQSGQRDDSARRANVLGAYEAAPGASLQGKVLLLCDDVVTTGSTLSECARILRTAGAKQIYGATLARARN